MSILNSAVGEAIALKPGATIHVDFRIGNTNKGQNQRQKERIHFILSDEVLCAKRCTKKE